MKHLVASLPLTSIRENGDFVGQRRMARIIPSQWQQVREIFGRSELSLQDQRHSFGMISFENNVRA